jgi:hypothetical protein
MLAVVMFDKERLKLDWNKHELTLTYLMAMKLGLIIDLCP